MLAKEVGIDLDSMEGFGGSVKWSTLPKDPIHFLLNHSDCDGHITAKRCAKIAPRLLELVAKWPDDIYDKTQALLLAEGMKACAQKGKPLEFC
jgi:hypothetical protein